jgi:hypothetical protein
LFQSLIGIIGNCNESLISDFWDANAFQSLIGIIGNCNRFGEHYMEMIFLAFQSLIGIIGNCNCPHLEALIYLVFKVRLRQSKMNIAFQGLGCQEGHFKNSSKALIARFLGFASTSN